jgi:hypothetical protein
MSVRSVVRSMLFVVLLLQAVGPGLARGPEPTKPSEAAGANASKAAQAPWFTLEIDTAGDTGQYASVAVRPSDGQTFVGYYNATSDLLRLASPKAVGGNCGPSNSWDCGTEDSGVDVGSVSIAIDPQNGAVGFAYHDPLNDTLNYHSTAGYSTVVDKKATVSESTGEYASLKYWGNGKPFIAYHVNDASGVDSLKVAYRDYENDGNCGYVLDMVTGEWQCDTIQTGEGVGQHAALVLDGGGHLHIAYHDGGDGDLWYATTRGTFKNCGPGGDTWFCYPVTSENDAGQYASLYVDNLNRFHIAYYGATRDEPRKYELKYAVDTGGGGNCGLLGSAQCDTIDSMMADYHHPGVSMAEDANGYPIIAYQGEFGSLKVARPLDALDLQNTYGAGNCGPPHPQWPSNGSWHCAIIDRYGVFVNYRNADYASIAVRPSGLATIAYYRLWNLLDGNLMVAFQRFHQVFLPLVVKNQ